MNNDTIFYTQIASIVVYVLALFSIYRLFVDQKDSVIQLLKERIADKDAKIQDLTSQTPDALVTALSSRIEIANKEVSRLKADGDMHKEEIETKEGELHALKQRLNNLSALIMDTDLVCKKCGAQLSRREAYPIYGYCGDHDVEGEGECIEYECGLELIDGDEVSPCKR